MLAESSCSVTPIRLQLWLGEPPTLKKLIAVVLAVGGVVIVILAPASAEINSPVVQARKVARL